MKNFKDYLVHEKERDFKRAQSLIEENKGNKVGNVVNGFNGAVVSGSKLVSVSKNELVYISANSITVVDGQKGTEDVLYTDLKALKKQL